MSSERPKFLVEAEAPPRCLQEIFDRIQLATVAQGMLGPLSTGAPGAESPAASRRAHAQALQREVMELLDAAGSHDKHAQRSKVSQAKSVFHKISQGKRHITTHQVPAANVATAVSCQVP